MPTELALPISHTSDDDGRRVGVGDVPRSILGSLVAGSLSPRDVLRLREVITVAAQIAGDLDRIDAHCHDMARRSAATTRAVERCATDIEEYVVKRAELALRLDTVSADRRHVPAARDEQARIDQLARDIQRAELTLRRSRLDDQRRAEDEARDRAPGRRVTPQTIRRADRAAAERDRHAAAATRIAREVAASCVPTGAKHPYHAFAACAYLSAKRAGASDGDAFTQTRDAVLDKMCGPVLTPEEAEASRKAYEELKAQAASAARFRATDATFTLYATGDEEESA